MHQNLVQPSVRGKNNHGTGYMENSDAHHTVSCDFPFFQLINNYFFFLSLSLFPFFFFFNWWFFIRYLGGFVVQRDNHSCPLFLWALRENMKRGGKSNNPGSRYTCAKWEGEGAGWRPHRPKRGWVWCLHILWEVGASFCSSPDAHKSPILVRQDVPWSKMLLNRGLLPHKLN